MTRKSSLRKVTGLPRSRHVADGWLSRLLGQVSLELPGHYLETRVAKNRCLERTAMSSNVRKDSCQELLVRKQPVLFIRTFRTANKEKKMQNALQFRT